ncbi:hypothetical protein ACRAWD_04640 [Caulobacter segnis]
MLRKHFLSLRDAGPSTRAACLNRLRVVPSTRFVDTLTSSDIAAAQAMDTPPLANMPISQRPKPRLMIDRRRRAWRGSLSTHGQSSTDAEPRAMPRT